MTPYIKRVIKEFREKFSRTIEGGRYLLNDPKDLESFLTTALQDQKKEILEEVLGVIGEDLNRQDMFYGKGEIEHGFEHAYNKAKQEIREAIKKMEEKG